MHTANQVAEYMVDEMLREYRLLTDDALEAARAAVMSKLRNEEVHALRHIGHLSEQQVRDWAVGDAENRALDALPTGLKQEVELAWTRVVDATLGT